MGRGKHIIAFLISAITIPLIGCGGGDLSGGTSPDFSLQGATPWHDFLNSPNYAGYLAVRFKDDSDVRLREGKFAVVPGETANSEQRTANKALHYLNQIVADHSAKVERGLDIPEDVIVRALEKAKSEGIKLHDWNLYFRIEVKDPNDAEALYQELLADDSVLWIHPVPVPYVSDIGDIGNIGNVAGGEGLHEQLYLDSEAETGGLNIRAAWNHPLAVTGQGVRILEQEYNWNLDHEALSTLDEEDVDRRGNDFRRIDPNDPVNVEHGTAVAGILAATENPMGLTGIARGGELKFDATDSSTSGALVGVVRRIEGYVNSGSRSEYLLRPGDIFVFEVQSPGRTTPMGEHGCHVVDINTPTYCVPVEAFSTDFEAIQDTVALGVIVVESAGNGGIDLRSAECENGLCADFNNEDSGAILVSASHGQRNHSKPAWANWGDRVDAYAWGYDVMTAGYGDLRPDGAEPNENNKYTARFSGASSATALVAGAVALIQSYTKEFYKDIVPHKEVYFDSRQIRDLIRRFGTAGDPNFHIGKKPDVGEVMTMIEAGDILPHLAPDTEYLLVKPGVVAGIRYDMDRDGRADLISWDQGLWKIDLSTVPPAGGCMGNLPDGRCDNYGEWDVRARLPYCDGAPTSCIIFPVVHDYDSDGDADLALYDSKRGIWYIKYTTPAVIASPPEADEAIQLSWDTIIDYSADPAWRAFGRPMPGDYNGDNWLDIAVVRADGHWIIDFGGIGRLEKQGADIVYTSDFGEFERDIKFLTDEQLAAAPGWAYLPVVVDYGGNKAMDLVYKVPDGIDGEGYLNVMRTSRILDVEDNWVSEEERDQWIVNNTTVSNVFNYGANDSIFIGANAIFGDFSDLFVIDSENRLSIVESTLYWDNYSLINENPNWTNDNFKYFAVVSDYDGDGLDDPVLVSDNGWGIAYYGYEGEITVPMIFTLEAEREVMLDFGTTALPASIYPGGMQYQQIRSLLQHYRLWDNYQDKDPFTPYTIKCIKNWHIRPDYCLAK